MQKSYPGLKIRKMMRSDIPKIVSIISRDLGALDGKKAKRDMTEQQQKLYVDGQVFVAEDKSGLLGVIGYWHTPYHPKKVCWMDWFGVEKNHKRMGIGSALLSHMLNFLAKRNIK